MSIKQNKFTNYDVAKQQAIDLKEMRAKANIEQQIISQWIYGGQSKLERLRYLKKLVIQDPIFNKKGIFDWKREDFLEWNFKVAKRLIELKLKLDLSDEDTLLMLSCINISNPIFLHASVFLSALRTQTDDEQRKEWLERAENYEIIGCYAQTELGHGSALNNLETTATYNPEDDTFIIHSPSISSLKFWPGGLAYFSNTSIVYAQLYIHGQWYGPHGFIVPLRDLEEHKVLDGIQLFDIGPKMGFHGVDHGCAKFDSVKIPRKNMLMRFSKVLKGGDYIHPPHPKLVYAVMTGTRVAIIETSWIPLAQAVTISLRYSMVRRQGVKPNLKEEPMILNYSMVQYQLLSLLANVFAIISTSRFMKKIYEEMINKIKKDQDITLLSKVHAISTALKAYCTKVTADGIEQARRTLGGHGYLLASGLPSIYNDNVAGMTYEGDNNLIAQQTVKYLLKQYELVLNNKEILDDNLLFLKSFIKEEEEEISITDQSILNNNELNFQFVEKVLNLSIYYSLKNLYTLKLKLKWDQLNVECVELCTIYAIFITINQFNNDIQLIKDFNFKKIFQLLLNIYINSIFLQSNTSNIFLKYQLITKNDINNLSIYLKTLFNNILPNTAILIDSFEFEDFTLNSDLGRFDGEVYLNLFNNIKDKNERYNYQMEVKLQNIMKSVTKLNNLKLNSKI